MYTAVRGSQSVIDAWGGNDFVWYQMLCKKRLCSCLASTEGQQAVGGKNFRSVIMSISERVEVEDQIETAKYLASLRFR